MANFTTSTPTTNDPANIYGLLGVGTDNEGQLLDPDALLAATNLSYTASPTQGVVTSDTGNDATIPAADGTNAGLFLPAEKTKLSGIAAGAEVNVNADWNAVSGDAQILNKPTVTTDHTALSNIGTNTHAQIDTAIGTIFSKVGDTLTGTAGSGFFGAIPQSSAPSTPGSGFRIYANASGLLEWKGTNGFTQTFDGSANTANRAYTLPNSSGTIAMEGSLASFANPSIQNGYYQFVQTTAPTQRSSGVPLVAGDRWYKPIDNDIVDTAGLWLWNGVYWVGTLQGISHNQLTNLSASGFTFSHTINTIRSVLVTNAICYTIVSNTNNSSNYWTFEVSLQSPQSNSRAALATFSTISDTVNERFGKTTTINQVVNSDFSTNQAGIAFYIAYTKVGTPNLAYASLALSYRHIHP